MRPHLINLTLCCFIFLQIACNNCNRVDCEGPGGTIKIRLEKNGQNAVFGSGAFIDRDSISFSVLDPLAYPYTVGFSEATQTINLRLASHLQYVLKIKNVLTDTFSVTSVETGMGECCMSYKLSNVKLNGQNICQDNCEEIIEIQL